MEDSNEGLILSQIDDRVVVALRKLGLEPLRYKPPHHFSYGRNKRAACATLLAMNLEILSASPR